MKDHGNQNDGNWTACAKVPVAGTHQLTSPLCFPSSDLASLEQGSSLEALPPCSCKVERVVVEDPLSRVGHTHAHSVR